MIHPNILHHTEISNFTNFHALIAWLMAM